MDRRIIKAWQILKDLPQDADMGEFLDVAAEMADETQTYPLIETARTSGDEILDLDELDDAEYNEILEAHEGLEKALNEYTGMIEKLNGDRE